MIKWMHAKIKKLSAIAVMGLTLAVPAAFFSTASAQDMDVAGPDMSVLDPIERCGGEPVPDKDASRWGRYFEANGVNIRLRPTTNSRICGQGQMSHRVDYHCYREGENGTWTYLRDVETHRAGWVKDTLLEGYGSYVHC